MSARRLRTVFFGTADFAVPVLMALLEAVVPPPSTDGADRVLVGAYGYMAVMETLGFAAFFGDRTVAAAGGAAMLPIAVAGAWRAVRGR